MFLDLNMTSNKMTSCAVLSEDNINARTQFNMPRSEVIENKSTYKTLDRYNSARFLKYPHPPHNLERYLTKYLRMY